MGNWSALTYRDPEPQAKSERISSCSFFVLSIYSLFQLSSGHRSKSVDELAGQSFDYVVTVCDNARDICPVFPAGTERIHWSFEDPAAVAGTEEERLAEFRRIRDQIHESVKSFYRQSQSGGRRQELHKLEDRVDQLRNRV